MEKKFVNNYLDFTPITVPAYNFIAIGGSIKSEMPNFIKAIEQGYRIGNYRDLALNRMEKYNSNAPDRSLLNDKYFTLVGNPTLGDPAGSGEQIIINDLNQKVFEQLKIQILGMNCSTQLNNAQALPLASNNEESKEIYEQIKREGLPYITFLSKENVNALKNRSYSMPDLREVILEGFMQGNLIEKREYKSHVQRIKGLKEDNSIDNIFGYYPGNFTDVRLVCAGSADGDADAGSGNNLFSYDGRLFGVGAGTSTTQNKN